MSNDELRALVVSALRAQPAVSGEVAGWIDEQDAERLRNKRPGFVSCAVQVWPVENPGVRRQTEEVRHVPIYLPHPQPASDKRDREADRARFPDPDFNRWLDEGISDCGHIVWHQVGDLADAWAAWEARPYYAKGRHPSVDSPEDELFNPQPARGEAVAWARNSGDPNDDAFVISDKVKRLWLASNPKRVARYTRPLYTTHVPCWALPAVESALSMIDLQGYWHSDLAAFRDWLKEKSQ